MFGNNPTCTVRARLWPYSTRSWRPAHAAAGNTRGNRVVVGVNLAPGRTGFQAGEAIQAGQRLTVADTSGHVRALRMVEIEGVKVDESDPT